MRNILMTAICVAALVSMQRATAGEGKHLFILSGQSNMAGLNPAISFTPAVEEAFGKENVIVVKDAKSGQPIRRWYKQWKTPEGVEHKGIGELYDRLIQKVNAAIEGQTLKSITFVWMQGERDAKELLGELYAESFQGVLKQLQADLQRDDINFVIGRLSDFDMANSGYRHWTVVRDAQVALAEAAPRGGWVDTDDLNDKPREDGTVKHDLHYTREGYKILGQRFAEKAIELIAATK